LAEIEDHLRCNLAQRVKLNQEQTQDPHAAIIYSIILEDRLATIVQLPGLPLSLQTTRIQQKETERILTHLTDAILKKNRPEVVIEDASTVYQWLVEPAEKAILEGKADIRTLVFVADGLLKAVPPAVLYDEQQQQYLVEKEQYAIAVLPSLQLFQQQRLSREGLRALKAGLSEQPVIPNRPNIPAIPYVQVELDETDAIVPGQRLLNATFTKAALKQQVMQSSLDLVHLATHGEFSSDPEGTFILAHDQEIYGAELDGLLRATTNRTLASLKLLILSACRTATGDSRATLGLAGITTRAGASSTLATLWQVNDAATADLVKAFYQEMVKPNVSLAEALHRAQLTLVKQVRYRHNHYIWAPYVLVGSWL
ncbi:MAG: CHAT domain-containing protein, partial [Leptolyngbyaceae cyanobacterium bins.59]|nr:CHAT domain-containing protein [Leptolyngbyaceae cyanobacterium bins.59]